MELSVENIIKIILGVLVVVAIAYGLYLFFSGNVIDFFKNVGTSSAIKCWLIF